jgi:hypothetical protein
MTHQDVIKLLELQRAVKELPSRYGFSNLTDFIRALEEFNREDGGNAGSTQPSTVTPTSTAPTPETPIQAENNRIKGKRLTPDDKDKIASRSQAGETAAAIARDMNCSVATIQNVKKARNLVRTPKPKSTPAIEGQNSA